MTLTALLLAVATAVATSPATTDVALPGEPCTVAPIPCKPFPDRMSAYVWRNWNLVPLDRLASVVKARPADLEQVAADLGLGPARPVLPEWRRKGYITVLRRNWHLLGYDQLTTLLDMTRKELAFSLAEDDFLWVKLGRVKPKCDPLAWTAEDAAESRRQARQRIAATLAEEKVDPSAPEEPRFAFIKTLAAPEPQPTIAAPQSTDAASPFDFRFIFSYFADYGDPLGDPEVRSYPEGLLQRLSGQGVNAVWLHTVLRTLAKDPKYPEWGEGSERRIANLKTLVARAAKYGIKVYLYLNEPRGMDEAFFKADPAREAFRGAPSDDIDIYAFCPSHPEPLRWLSDSLEQVFSQVPGLGGVFTITMSENMTHCKARRTAKPCPRCAKRSAGDIVAAINRATVEGMRRGNPDADAVLYTWAWPEKDVPEILAKLPKKGCRILTVSENGMQFVRGGTSSTVYDYSISVVGPGERALKLWERAAAAGFSTVAKVQVANSWELSSFPYLPVDELNARHAVNLANAGVNGVMLSWSCGCYPAPNLAVYRELRSGERTPDALLDRLAAARYGAANVPRVRRAWKAFADGFSEYPFHVAVLYSGPQQWGVANPLYAATTGYPATMVGIPYDDVGAWRGPFPPKVFAGQMDKVAKGFAEGCRELEGVANPRELDMFKAEMLHFESSADQVRFVLARDAGDRKAQVEIARRELERARAYLPIVRADSRIGYESSNHYFFIPRDVVEKILSCRQVIDALAEKQPRLEKTPVGVKCMSGDRTVWEFAVEGGKPRVHPMAFPDGTVFTDCRPKDHPWHRGLWFCWKHLNGVNFWEVDASGKSVGEQRAVLRDVEIDGLRAEVTLDVEWIAGNKTLLSETRRIVLTAPDERGAYAIRWQADFTARERTVLSSSQPRDTPQAMSGGYAGMSLRLKDCAKTYVCEVDPGKSLVYRSPSGSSVTVRIVKAPPTVCYHWPDNRFTSFSPVRGKTLTLEPAQTLSLEYEIEVR